MQVWHTTTLEKPTLRYGVLNTGYIFKEPLCFPSGAVLTLGAPFLQKAGKPKKLLLPVLRYGIESTNADGDVVRIFVDAIPSTVVVCADLGEAMSKKAVKAYTDYGKKLRQGQ